MKKVYIAMVFYGALAGASVVSADTIFLDGTISGPPPGGSPPWAWVDLEPTTASVFGQVYPSTHMLMQANLQAEGEHITRWYFDLVPELTFDDIFDFLGLSSGKLSGPDLHSSPIGGLSRAEPESRMDFYFEFDHVAEGTSPFDTDSWSQWGVIGVQPSDFAGTMAEVQVAAGTSLIAPVPEPATMLLLGTGFGLVGLLRKKALGAPS